MRTSGPPRKKAHDVSDDTNGARDEASTAQGTVVIPNLDISNPEIVKTVNRTLAGMFGQGTDDFWKAVKATMASMQESIDELRLSIKPLRDENAVLHDRNIRLKNANTELESSKLAVSQDNELLRERLQQMAEQLEENETMLGDRESAIKEK